MKKSDRKGHDEKIEIPDLLPGQENHERKKNYQQEFQGQIFYHEIPRDQGNSRPEADGRRENKG